MTPEELVKTVDNLRFLLSDYRYANWKDKSLTRSQRRYAFYKYCNPYESFGKWLVDKDWNQIRKDAGVPQ